MRERDDLEDPSMTAEETAGFEYAEAVMEAVESLDIDETCPVCDSGPLDMNTAGHRHDQERNA